MKNQLSYGLLNLLILTKSLLHTSSTVFVWSIVPSKVGFITTMFLRISCADHEIFERPLCSLPSEAELFAPLSGVLYPISSPMILRCLGQLCFSWWLFSCPFFLCELPKTLWQIRYCFDVGITIIISFSLFNYSHI